MEAKKIIITGGATRIGAAIEKKLSGPGKEIIIHYNKHTNYNSIKIFYHNVLNFCKTFLQ